jgi:hypothetical protein
MTQDIQKRASAIGKAGCYYLSVLSLAEELGAGKLDPLDLFDAFASRGWLGPDAFMNDPAAIIGMLTKGPWRVRKAGEGKDTAGRPYDLPMAYQLQPGEYEVLRFERPLAPNEKASADTAHFVRGRGTGPMDRSRVLWDPWTDSRAVNAGKLMSRRIFTRA